MIWREDRRNICGIKDPTLATKEIPLYSGHDKGITKYEYFDNSRSHWKTTSP